jgi:hypothetical protein
MLSLTEYHPRVQGKVHHTFGEAFRGVRQRRVFDITVAALAWLYLVPLSSS